MVGDGCGQVSLAHAVWTGEGKPSPWVVGVDPRHVVCLAKLRFAYLRIGEAVGLKVLESEASEVAEVAVGEESFVLLAFEARFLALAGGDGAEIRVADGNVGTDPTAPIADLAPAVGVVRLLFGRDVPATTDRTGGG